MLTWLKIKNLALVEDVEIEFGKNFNVITGETGAGKSVIMGSIALLLGERADKSMIRFGEKRSEVSAEILIPNHLLPDLNEIFEPAGILLEEHVLVIRRVITATTTRNFINDTSVTLQLLKKVGDLLIDIHGVNDHQSLFKQTLQLKLLDRFGETQPLLTAYQDAYKQLKQIQKEAAEQLNNLPSAIEAEHLKMTIDEIKKVDPQPHEDDEIAEKFKRAANSKDLVETASKIAYALDRSDNSIVEQFSNIYRELQHLEQLDEEGCSTYVNDADNAIEIMRCLADDLENYASSVEIDSEEFMMLEERLGAIQRIKRRYGPYLENVFKTLEEAELKLHIFENAESVRVEFEEREKQQQKILEEHATQLSKARQKIATSFSKQVTDELKTLGFLNAEFSVAFEQVPLSLDGWDRIDFLVSPNPGIPAQPLRKIGSSGEISRVMLAIKTVLAESDSVPILIFDEIDVNIGGEAAICVANELKKLAQTHQLLCISHLPTVAAKGDSHFLVKKDVVDDITVTKITELTKSGRLKEITRMLGGGKAATNHAKELLA